MDASVIRQSLVQIMACRLLGAKPFSEQVMGYCQLEPWNKFQLNENQNTKICIQQI